ncbi:hypothetical protein [Muricoccus radiodurans]|uniref:hypothetical protein n=1 Tax=Muricoccus radiodurans TaxID=2231721 RepID=UPI003CF650CA
MSGNYLDQNSDLNYATRGIGKMVASALLAGAGDATAAAAAQWKVFYLTQLLQRYYTASDSNSMAVRSN